MVFEGPFHPLTCQPYLPHFWRTSWFASSLMMLEVSNEEIIAVIFSSSNNKVWSRLFHKRILCILLGHCRNSAIKYFFEKGKLLGALNHFFLSFIPKTSDTKSFNYFRTISLCFRLQLHLQIMASRVAIK